MNQLKIPELCIQVIINLFSKRKNAVFTVDGLSDYYDVRIGIDQEEFILPLLWCIYLIHFSVKLNKGYLI